MRAYQKLQVAVGSGPSTRTSLKCLLIIVLTGGWAAGSEISLVERAEKGEAAAQFELGMNYYRGDGVPKDSTAAVKWVRKAAEQGFATAQDYVGDWYCNGRGVPKDFAEAVKWYRKAAEQGQARAQFHLGEMYRYGTGVPEDMAEALKWYHKAAENGELTTLRMLGAIYSLGDEVPKDSVIAVKWVRKAAEQGDASSQHTLGRKYEEGEGVPKDSVEAVIWYRKAAEQGLRDAQWSLGGMYANGHGVPKDSGEALMWYCKAAERGWAEYQHMLGRMYAVGNGIPKSSAEAIKWYRKAADQGHAAAQNSLGWVYVNGEGVPKDTIEGLAWFNIASANPDYIWAKRFAKDRDTVERVVGPQATLVAQQRSKQLIKEIEAAKASRDAGLSQSNDSDFTIAPADETPKASGSGAIVSTTGHVLTAAHVVAGARGVRIITAQGKKSASVLRIDAVNDVAVLKLTDGTYPALSLVSSRTIRLGQPVSTIGFPNTAIQGFSPKVTRGEISSLNGIGDDPRAWQISAPVQPGNSGGPLLDENGSVIGVVVSKLGIRAAKITGDIPQNVNYAVKSSYALALLEPYLDSAAPTPNPATAKPKFEDMVAKAQQSVVLIQVY